MHVGKFVNNALFPNIRRCHSLLNAFFQSYFNFLKNQIIFPTCLGLFKFGRKANRQGKINTIFGGLP